MVSFGIVQGIAEAIVYAMMLIHKAKLVTNAADLASLPGVVYHKKS